MRALAVALAGVLVLGGPTTAQEPPAAGPWCVRVELWPGESPPPPEAASVERAIADGVARVTEVGACRAVSGAPTETPAVVSEPHGLSLAMSELTHGGTLGIDLDSFRSSWNGSSSIMESLRLGSANIEGDVFGFKVGGQLQEGILLGGKLGAGGEISAVTVSWSPDEAGATDGLLAIRNYSSAQMLITLTDVLTPSLSDRVLDALGYPLANGEPWGEREHQVTEDGVTYTLVSYPDADVGGTTVWFTARAADAP